MNSISENLKNRDQERIINQFKTAKQYTINFIKLSSEEGVIRNGGRRGTKFGPTALLNTFKKLAQKSDSNSFNEIELSNPELEAKDFKNAQSETTTNIINELKAIEATKHVFIGGGHDYIYPCVEAIKNVNPNRPLLIINIDPHLDTRVDEFYNSGTPFRQIDQNATENENIELIQLGTHQFANVKSSKKELAHIHQKILGFDEIKNQTNNFNDNFDFFQLYFKTALEKNPIVILSLDVDAIESSVMEAVSAVNHRGFPVKFVEDIFDYFKENQSTYYGLYEYNPLYDNLSGKGARFLASLIYRLV